MNKHNEIETELQLWQMLLLVSFSSREDEMQMQNKSESLNVFCMNVWGVNMSNSWISCICVKREVWYHLKSLNWGEQRQRPRTNSLGVSVTKEMRNRTERLERRRCTVWSNYVREAWGFKSVREKGLKCFGKGKEGWRNSYQHTLINNQINTI